ncbi:MAG: hypothetical protein CV045_08420 [Cyanobacteria bacterium M5B4]|nr:MAG: hypothetical protein CV045_08420 [Cyanobacteria bacterium M5B4]
MSSVIAIDTGKRNVGLAVFQGLEVVKCYLLNASSLSHHYYQFNSIIEEYNPDVVAFEKPFFSPSTMATGYEIIEVIGVEKLVLEQKQIEILEFPATTVKKIQEMARIARNK